MEALPKNIRTQGINSKQRTNAESYRRLIGILRTTDCPVCPSESHAMTENSVAQESPTSSKPRSKGGVPRTTLATTETYARAIWTTAHRGEALPAAVARAISGKADSKAVGGAWRAKPAALRVFGLVARLNSENLKLSEIGLALVDESNPAGQAHARRQAVLGVSSYQRILADHNGHPLPSEDTIATTFEYQYEVPVAAAKEVAKVFVESVKYAGLLGSDGSIKIDETEVPEIPEPEKSTLPKPPKPTVAPKAGTLHTSKVAPARQDSPPLTNFVAPRPPGSDASTPVDVTVNIDMSKWEAKDVLSVLKVLGYGDSSD